MSRRSWISVAASVACFAVLTAGAGQSAEGDPEFTFGEIVDVAPDVLLVVGRDIDLGKGEIDVANALLYKSGTTLVVVDTGGTAEFAGYLDAAAKRLAPFDDVVLISTHGHADHVGNNAWIDTLGVPATHLISTHDLGVMRDQVGYFSSSLGEVLAQDIVDLFGGLDTEAETMRVIESLPLQALTLGGTAWSGWSLLDGDVFVLRTAGHTAGHVVVFLAGPKLLHLGDETTSWYQAFSDGTAAGPAGNLLTLQRAANAVASGAVDLVTDGHTFRVLGGDDAIAFLNRLIGGAVAFDAAVTRILNENPGGLAVPDLVAKVVDAPEMADVPGGPTNPYNYLQMTNKLRELGVIRPVNPTSTTAFPD
ncbi:MAG: MBL fold metallo-hydrolase [Hyphomicrobiales bacterium]|nr:MBL fold metallo-hydrolase [Hyphomicrobiales bacterium]